MKRCAGGPGLIFLSVRIRYPLSVALIKADIPRLGKIVRDSGARVD